MTIDNSYGTKELEKDFGPLTFGNALESHRKCEEVSQKDFAALLGISAQSLCDIEKGRKIPTITRAVKIAHQINEPEKIWIRLVLQDMLRNGNLNYTVSLT